MSQENVAALRRVYEAMARGDFWAAREVFDPEIEWEWSAGATGLTGGGTYHGIAGVEAATRDWFEVWDWFWQEAEEYIAWATRLWFSPACTARTRVVPRRSYRR